MTVELDKRCKQEYELGKARCPQCGKQFKDTHDSIYDDPTEHGMELHEIGGWSQFDCPQCNTRLKIKRVYDVCGRSRWIVYRMPERNRQLRKRSSA